MDTGAPAIHESLVYDPADTHNHRVLRGIDFRAVRLGDGIAAAWRDITDRKRAEQDSARSHAELMALYQVSSVVSSTIELTEMLPPLLGTLAALPMLELEPRGALLVKSGSELRLASSHGMPEGCAALSATTPADAPCAKALRTARPAWGRMPCGEHSPQGA